MVPNQVSHLPRRDFNSFIDQATRAGEKSALVQTMHEKTRLEGLLLNAWVQLWEFIIEPLTLRLLDVDLFI